MGLAPCAGVSCMVLPLGSGTPRAGPALQAAGIAVGSSCQELSGVRLLFPSWGGGDALPHPVAGQHVASAAKPWLAPHGFLPSWQVRSSFLAELASLQVPPSSCPAVTHRETPTLSCMWWDVWRLGQRDHQCHWCWGHPAGQEEPERAEGGCSWVGSDLEGHRQHPHVSSLTWGILGKRKGLPGEAAFNQCP